jgi:hypothetical protein
MRLPTSLETVYDQCQRSSEMSGEFDRIRRPVPVHRHPRSTGPALSTAAHPIDRYRFTT